jgi:hypothetical protein
MKEFIEKLIARLEEEKGKVVIDGKEMYQEDYFIDIDDAIEIVNQLAGEHKGGWIPCSERLPEYNQAVLTCEEDGWISVNFNIQFNGKKNDFECGYYTAWMPLPEPYKAEDLKGGAE